MLANASPEELLEQMSPITDNMLAQTSEASISGKSASAQAFVDWDAIATEVEGRLDDGTPISYTVHDLSAASISAAATHAAGGSGGHGLVAASFPDLLEQADGEADHQVISLNVSEPPALPGVGVAALGVQGGIRPSSDVRLFGTEDSHVFGAPRTKTLKLKGLNKISYISDVGGKYSSTGTWCFRIASVKVAGAMRTRLVATCIDGKPKGAMRFIEFDTGIEGMPRDELCNYDFDIDKWRSTSGEDEVHMVRGSDKCHYLLLNVDLYDTSNPLNSVQRCEDYSPSIRLVPCGNSGYYLTSYPDDPALAPGKTSVYAVTVTVPTSWKSGEKKVLFVASDGVQAPDSAENDGNRADR